MRAHLRLAFLLCIVGSASGAWFGGSKKDDEKPRAYFKAMDKDGDGVLNESEFLIAVQGTPLDPRGRSEDYLQELTGLFRGKEGATISWKQWTEIFEGEMPELKEGQAGSGAGSRRDEFQEHDKNGDGVLSKKEAKDEDAPQSWNEYQFKKHDQDGDGVLNRSEAKRLMGKADWELTGEDDHESNQAVDELFQELDADLSESISMDEWLSEGLSNIFSGLMGNTHAFSEYEQGVDDMLDPQDLSFK